MPPVRTMPSNPITMLRSDLKPYLAHCGANIAGSGPVMRWYYRQFLEAANQYLFRDADERRQRHKQLAEFF